MARPTKLNKVVQRKICDHIRNGCTLENAAVAAGITASTFHRWIGEGKEAEDGEKREFYDAVARARAESESKLVELLQKHAKTDPRTAQFILERRFPEAWGRREKLDVNLSRQAQALVEGLKLTPEDMETEDGES